MLRGTLRVVSLVNHQSKRGMTTLKDIKVKLDPVKNVQKITQIAAKYAIELAPPTPAELPRAIRDGVRLFRNTGNLKNLTVREAWQNTLITVEVICWFFVGECIGKGNIVGYQV